MLLLVPAGLWQVRCKFGACCAAAVTWERLLEWAVLLPPALGRLAVARPAQQAQASVTQHLQAGNEPDQAPLQSTRNQAPLQCTRDACARTRGALARCMSGLQQYFGSHPIRWPYCCAGCAAVGEGGLQAHMSRLTDMFSARSASSAHAIWLHLAHCMPGDQPQSLFTVWTAVPPVA